MQCQESSNNFDVYRTTELRAPTLTPLSKVDNRIFAINYVSTENNVLKYSVLQFMDFKIPEKPCIYFTT